VSVRDDADCLVQREWIRSAGLDVWNLPKLHADIAESQKLSEELEHDTRVLGQRIAVKTISEATDRRPHEPGCRHREVPRTQRSLSNEHLRLCFPAKDERELSARNVMAFASRLWTAKPMPRRSRS